MVPAEPDISKVMITDVLTTDESATAMDAIRLMAKKDVGAIVITRGRVPIGMFTERDLINKIVLHNLDPATLPVCDVMTRRLVTVSPDCTITMAYNKMMEKNFRHLLVVEKDKTLAGILSIKDLARIREHELQIEVERKTHEIEEARKKLNASLHLIKKEMAFAGNFQKQLIEKKFPSFRRVKVSHLYHQADSLGGDYLSVVSIDRDHAGILVADVMGHGITSAMIAVEIKMQYDLLSKNVFFPGLLVSEMNRTISNLMPPGFFVAGFCAVLNLKTLHLRYTQFGLPGTGVLRGETGKYELFEPCQVPIGIKPDASFPEREAFIQPGDKLFIFTDGCIEQKGRLGKLLGQNRFLRQFKRLSNEGAKSILPKLYDFVLEYTGHEKHSDDIAMLLLEFSKNGSSKPPKD